MDEKSVKAGLGPVTRRVSPPPVGTGSTHSGRSRFRIWRRIATVAAVGSMLTLFGCSNSLQGSPASHSGSSRSGKTTGEETLAGVQYLYSEDMVARVNAERAARSTATAPVPQLQVNPSLQAEAQAWSAHLASTGTVADPSLSTCGGSPGQVCAFAANSGSSGYGFWPGDGSDGTDGDFMASVAHRQNELGAAYQYIGVGVTCADNQAWTVEIFGYSLAQELSAANRQSAQQAVQGDPVPQTPMVAGTPSGDPVYCPGQTYGPHGEVTATGGQYPYPNAVPTVPGEPGTAQATVVGMAATPGAAGYWLARADGSIDTFGDAVNYGSMAGQILNAPITHIVATPDGKGYWLVGSDGGIFAFGDAGFFGSMGGHLLNAPVVDLAPTADGRGYWLVAADGGIFAFGDARFHGSMGGHSLDAPIVGMAADNNTGGYWLVGSDGGIFAMDAPFDGSTGGIKLNQPVNGMSATPSGKGYWLVANDGAIFAFGNAPFEGSTGGMTLVAPVVGMTPDSQTGGYWLVGSDGGVFAFNSPFLGSR